MQADLQAQEEFLMSGEKPSAAVIRKKAASSSPSPPQKSGPTLLSALTSVKEVKERSEKRDKVVLPMIGPEKGFPTAETVSVFVARDR